jgi:hypothetical protein
MTVKIKADKLQTSPAAIHPSQPEASKARSFKKTQKMKRNTTPNKSPFHILSLSFILLISNRVFLKEKHSVEDARRDEARSRKSTIVEIKACF